MFFEQRTEEQPGVRIVTPGHGLGGPGGDDLPATHASPGSETDLAQRLEADAHGGDVAEEVESLGHREVEHFRDAPTLELHLERLPVVAAATADLARDVDVGKEMHLDRDHALARAGLAAAPLHVEGEAAGSVASRASFGQL